MFTFNGIPIVNERPTVLRVKWARTASPGESLRCPVTVVVDRKMKGGVCRHHEVPNFGRHQLQQVPSTPVEPGNETQAVVSDCISHRRPGA